MTDVSCIDTEGYDYMHGSCYLMAYALHEIFDFSPIYGLVDKKSKEDSPIHHMFIYDKHNDIVIDWLGLRKSKDIFKYYDLSPLEYRIAKMNQQQIDSCCVWAYSEDELDMAKKHARMNPLIFP